MYEFKVDDVNLSGVDWKSPLQLKRNDIYEDIGRATAKAFDDMVFRAVAEVGIEVDRDELIKALAYDRGQYEKGYGDGYRAAKDEIVRCKDCKYWETVEYYPDGTKDVCRLLKRQTQDDCFCSYGERKDDAGIH